MIKNFKQTAENRQRMAVRNKFIKKYNTDIDEYLKDDDIEAFSENLAGVLGFTFNFIFPIILFGLISLIASIILAIVYSSAVFGICLFAAGIPIFIFGIGSISFSYAVKKLVSGILFVIEFTVNKTDMIYNDLVKTHEKKVPPIEIAEIVIYTLIIPSGNKALKENIFTFIPYFFIKKIMKLVAKRSYIKNEKALIVVKDPVASQSTFVRKFNRRYKKIRPIINFLMYTLMAIAILIGILASLFGILLLIGIFNEPSIRDASNASGGLFELILRAIRKLFNIITNSFDLHHKSIQDGSHKGGSSDQDHKIFHHDLFDD